MTKTFVGMTELVICNSHEELSMIVNIIDSWEDIWSHRPFAGLKKKFESLTFESPIEQFSTYGISSHICIIKTSRDMFALSATALGFSFNFVKDYSAWPRKSYIHHPTISLRESKEPSFKETSKI